jgi:ABC-type sugar transport system substrate-binding protein
MQLLSGRTSSFMCGGRRFGVALALAAALCATACGSSSSSKSSSAATSESSTTSGSSTAGVTYSGPEANLPASYPTPTVKAHAHCVIGWLDPSQAVVSLAATQAAAVTEAAALHCKFIPEDAQGEVDTQVSDLNNLLAQKISVLIYDPLSPGALAPGLKQVAAKGIPVVSVDTPGIAGVPSGEPTEVVQGYDKDAFATTKYIAAEKPGAQFATMGIQLPVPALQYYVKRLAYWGTKFGLKYLGNVNAGGPSVDEATSAATTILNKYKSVQVIATYTDDAALAAAAVVRESSAHVLVTGSNGEAPAVHGVATGELLSTYLASAAGGGTQAIIAGYELLTKQHLPLPKFVEPSAELVTKANANSVKPVTAP